MTERKNETRKEQPSSGKSTGDQLLHDLNYKLTSALPEGLQKLQVSACDHMAKYPDAVCQGIRDAVSDRKGR